MTSDALFSLLLVTVLLTIGGAREIIHRNFALGVLLIAIPNFALGILLIAIPICGWASIWMTP